jgi:hypothetical protein
LRFVLVRSGLLLLVILRLHVSFVAFVLFCCRVSLFSSLRVRLFILPRLRVVWFVCVAFVVVVRFGYRLRSCYVLLLLFTVIRCSWTVPVVVRLRYVVVQSVVVVSFVAFYSRCCVSLRVTFVALPDLRCSYVLVCRRLRCSRSFAAFVPFVQLPRFAVSVAVGFGFVATFDYLPYYVVGYTLLLVGLRLVTYVLRLLGLRHSSHSRSTFIPTFTFVPRWFTFTTLFVGSPVTFIYLRCV